jgi:hypothetical protein
MPVEIPEDFRTVSKFTAKKVKLVLIAEKYLKAELSPDVERLFAVIVRK